MAAWGRRSNQQATRWVETTAAGRMFGNMVIRPVCTLENPSANFHAKARSVADLAMLVGMGGLGDLGALGDAGDALATADDATTAAAPIVVGPDGIAVPTDADELKRGLSLLQDASTNPVASRKFVGTDSSGLPLRIRIERAHPESPSYTGPIDSLHVVDHLHLDRRANGATGSWSSSWKIPLDWPW